MATKQRLTKTQIKQDQFITTMFKAQEYFREHMGMLLAGIAAVVAIVVVVVFFISSSQAKEQEASAIFGKASVEFRGGNFQLAAVDFQNLLDNYGGTDAARLASYYIASAYFELKNYDQAEEFFRMHVDKHAYDDMLTASALAGIGHCQRAKGLMREAGDTFRKVYEKYPSSYVADDCLYSAVKSYAVAGENQGALELYEEFEKVPGQTGRLVELKQILVEKGILSPSTGLFD